MWVDDDGVIHSISFGDPLVFIGASADWWIASLCDADRQRLQAWADAEYPRFADALDPADPVFRSAVGQVPDRPLVGEVSGWEEFMAAYDAVPPQWKLDVIEAVCESLDGPLAESDHGVGED